ncbi:HAD-IA family hydrolase [Nocardia abscessus]|uniref:HAD-IA family hydrolase n=1 Tax=Nocardia abscessus TaxID=120957 RepID=A0ABS0CFC1_9NOCA|nr:HAD-IA family hydrolase [Nocardia abscessus]MBF6227113.1 HAD-IA family hydrolase [Nocardia abscessus]
MTGFEGIEAVLLDWDGVLHYWQGDGEREGEQAESLPAKAIASAAYGTDAYEYAKLGIFTDAQWRASVAENLARRFDGRGREAVRMWSADRGHLADGAIEFLAQLRERFVVALLSDSTDILVADLERFGVDTAFDHIFVSARAGMTKPAPALYQHAATAMSVPPARILVVDDLLVNLPGARSVGMQVAHFSPQSSLSSFVHEHPILEEPCSFG